MIYGHKKVLSQKLIRPATNIRNVSHRSYHKIMDETRTNTELNLSSPHSRGLRSLRDARGEIYAIDHIDPAWAVCPTQMDPIWIKWSTASIAVMCVHSLVTNQFREHMHNVYSLRGMPTPKWVTWTTRATWIPLPALAVWGGWRIFSESKSRYRETEEMMVSSRETER